MKDFSFVVASIGLTALSWGVYGPLMRFGTTGMGGSHMLPFVCVGIAYFLVAVLAPWALMATRGEQGGWTVTGTIWSVLAGAAGAVGALGVILAFSNGGSPIYVMPLVFGCAPVINTFVTMAMSKTFREAGSFFYAGLILVVVGAATVLFFNPAAAQAKSVEMVPVLFALMTALCWGGYGPVLHKGQMLMKGSRLRPFMCVGLAYFLVAVVVPLLLIQTQSVADHGEWTFDGTMWSLLGGTAGALGALGIILAFTFGGKPVYVMPLVFGGAPVINTATSIAIAHQQGKLSDISPLFYAGLIVVVAGAVTVLLFAPKPHPKPAAK